MSQQAEYTQAEIADMLSAPVAPVVDAATIDTAELPKQVVAQIVPTDAEIEAVRAYFALLRTSLHERVAEIETFLGFVEVEGDLAVRVGKLEHFTGLKGR